MTRSLFTATLLALIFSSMTLGVKCQDENKNITFDYFIFAQIWPYSLCDACNLIHKDSCAVPQGASDGWTIHGLWPSRTSGAMGPEMCDPKDHFDMEKIKPIVDQLLYYWPNLDSHASVDSLWSHEWVKHGTCAEQLPQTNGELNYFTQTLGSHERYSVQMYLKQAGIEPSLEAKYKAIDILSALEKGLGKKLQIHCLKATEDSKVKWFYVDTRVCLDKELELIDCPQHHENEQLDASELLTAMNIPNVEQCPPDTLLYYIPPRPDHYHTDEQSEMHDYAFKKHEYHGGWDDHRSEYRVHDGHEQRDEL